jgi:hypothetical protein
LQKPKIKLASSPKRGLFLHVRGELRGAECEVIAKVNRKIVRVRLLNGDGELEVAKQHVRYEAPTSGVRITGGGLPGLRRR